MNKKSDTPNGQKTQQTKAKTEWVKVAEPNELDDGRVKTVVVGRKSLALSRVGDEYGALDNHCPHQGGPMGEGSIEKGWLRCPWHGFDYDPLTGKPPPPFTDAVPCFKTEARDDGVYVELPESETGEKTAGRTVSNILVETMQDWGVDTVFGMVGHSNLGFADAMRQAEQAGTLRYFGIRHEGAAAFAACGYGKLSGELSACFGIAGPGSTNLLTGLYDAKLDRAPVLAISGQVPSSVVSRGAFQDLDLASAFKDVASYSTTVMANSDYAELMNLACKNALINRDVAHLILPDEVQAMDVPEDREGGKAEGRMGDQKVRPSEASMDEAAKLISAAKRPLIILGAGARFAREPIVEMAEHLGIPVATTFKAKGQISDKHPLGCGVLGRSGTPIASWFMNESDLVVVFGASFSNHTGITPYKPIIQVDFDPMAIGRFHSVDVGLQGDVEVTARALMEKLDACPKKKSDEVYGEIAERWAIWREEKSRRVKDDRGEGVASAAIFAALSELAPKNAVMCVDVGNNTYSFGRYFEVEEQAVLMSGYLGSIGFGFPAAMGCWAYETSKKGSGRPVISVSGDGGFGQYAMELTTAVKYEMDITHILINNFELGKITKEQRASELEVYHTSLHNPDFSAFAELCGAKGIRVEDPKDLETAIKAGLDHKGVSLVEVICDSQLV